MTDWSDRFRRIDNNKIGWEAVKPCFEEYNRQKNAVCWYLSQYIRDYMIEQRA